MYIYIYIHTHICIYTYVLHISVDMYAQLYACVFIHTYTYVYIHTCHRDYSGAIETTNSTLVLLHRQLSKANASGLGGHHDFEAVYVR